MEIWDPMHVKRFSNQELSHLAAEAGFDSIEVLELARSGFALGDLFIDRIHRRLGLPRVTERLARLDKLIPMDTPGNLLMVGRARSL